MKGNLENAPNLQSNEVIGAGQVCPPFSEDLAKWWITVDDKGILQQEVSRFIGGTRGEELQQHAAQIRPEDSGEILAIAERIGFRGFKKHYTFETMGVTDMPTWAISIRFGNEVKTVRAYCPQGIVHFEGNRDMKGFMELWERIHRHAPFPND